MKFSRALLICTVVVGVLRADTSQGSSLISEIFTFKEPGTKTYLAFHDPSAPPPAWMPAMLNNGTSDGYQLGSKVVLQAMPGADVDKILSDAPLTIVQNPIAYFYVLQADDAWIAAWESQRLAAREDVLVCHPDMQKPIKKGYTYADYPDDTYFDGQWHLEHRETNGLALGVDVNARGAWPHTSGAGVNIAVVDEGVELTHPDLAAALEGQPHFNWETGSPFAGPVGYHGTAVAGLAGAIGRNGTGVSGVARNAGLVSWRIFGFGGSIASGTQLGAMFQAYSNTVQVQNHSWSFSTFQQLSPQLVEEIGISNAVHFGRDGKGVVMVRSAGNGRVDYVSANDDGYVNNPLIVAVGATRNDGLYATYSNPGACILVTAPSGDNPTHPGVLTTDLLGTAGLNFTNTTSDFNNYAYFSGTSASAPIVSGIVALLLEANPDLSYRDVQQILIQAATQRDLNDPVLVTNQAGYLVGLNSGFGTPDAGRAVRLAENWPLRPAKTVLTLENNATNQIPNLGLRIETFGTDIPVQIASIPGTPSLGIHSEDLTSFYPIVDVGTASSPITEDLTGKVALIERGENTFKEKIQAAADAGAEFAVISNYDGDDQRIIMADTHRAPIPAAFIVGSDGSALRNFLTTNGTAQVRSILFTAQYTNHVETPLLVEHVQVRLKTDHPRRGDLRVTLTSPSGTRCMLQNISEDFNGGPIDWTYMTTHHFYESSQGVWTIQVSDENNPPFGRTLYSELILHGVEIVDADRDGLDDNWELTHFQNLAAKSYEDANGDGESNMREYIQGTDPLETVGTFELSISQWKPGWMRVGWPGNPNSRYDVFTTTNATKLMTVTTNLAGRFDSMDWITPSTNSPTEFYQIRSEVNLAAP